MKQLGEFVVSAVVGRWLVVAPIYLAVELRQSAVSLVPLFAASFSKWLFTECSIGERCLNS